MILEGLEKAERNVLPIINNLLENREMALEDGRFLVEAKRYDDLAKNRPASELASFVRVHPGFRVVAVAVPVPPFPGNPLDPPLRSRFQARIIRGSSVQNLAGAIRRAVPDSGNVSQVKLLLALVASVREVASAQATAAGSQARDMAYRHLPYYHIWTYNPRFYSHRLVTWPIDTSRITIYGHITLDSTPTGS